MDGYARLEEPKQDRTSCIGFSPDGTQLVVSSDGQSLHVWDLRALREELAPRGLHWDLPAADPNDAPPCGSRWTWADQHDPKNEEFRAFRQQAAELLGRTDPSR